MNVNRFRQPLILLLLASLGLGMAACTGTHKTQTSQSTTHTRKRQAGVYQPRVRTQERTRKRPGYENPEAVLAERSSRSRNERRSRTSDNPDPNRPATTAPSRTERRTESTNEPVRTEGLRPTAEASKVIAEAKTYLGTRYQWGGMSHSGVDCSGLMVLAFKAAGINLPRVSGDQYAFGRSLNRRDLRPGDLLFFRSSGAGIGHSGLVVEVLPTGEVKFIHSQNSGVIISSLNDAHWNAHYLSACRVLPP